MLVLATMTLFLAPAVLIPVHGVVQLGSNVGRATLMFRSVLREVLPVFLIGTILGAAIGANLVVALPISLLQFILATFILYSTWAPKFQAAKPSKMTFYGVGAVSAFVTMFVGVTGVPSVNSIRRRNPGILGVPATALAGCTEGRPVDDEAR